MLSGFSFALTNFMSITLFQVLDTIDPLEYLSLPCTFLLGVLICRAILRNLLLNKETRTKCDYICKVLCFWDFAMFERILDEERKIALQLS